MIDGVSHPLLRRRTALADRGTILSVVSWILLVIVISVLIARFAMKLSRRSSRQRLGLDDLFISLAALFSIGQTIAVSIESTHALGQHSWELQPGALLILMKAEYAASMLYVLNMGCGRISLCLLIRKLVPGPVASYTSLGFAGLTALWTVSGVLVIAFACSLPTPWLFWITKCIDLRRFINYICITSIVVEVLLMMIPLFVWNIRLSAGRRLSVSCAFLSRLSIVAAVAAQLYFYNRTSETPEMTYHHWPTVLCTQIAQNLSVITACLPCLHPLVISILAGTTTVNTVNFTSPRSLKDCFSIKAYRVNGTSSQSSSAPMNEKGANGTGGDYCHPLATYGLDLSTAHLTSKPSPDHSPSGSSTTTVTKASIQEPENFFNRLIETPLELPRPPTATKRPPPIPESLEDCGILPAAPAFDSDTEGSAISRAGSPSRRPDTEYILDRQKVISVPEDRAFDRGQYWNEYYPPLPSPTMPRK